LIPESSYRKQYWRRKEEQQNADRSSVSLREIGELEERKEKREDTKVHLQQ